MRMVKLTMVLMMFASIGVFGQISGDIYAEVHGDTAIVYHTGTQDHCAFRPEMIVTQVAIDSLHILERDTMGAFADCICYFDLRTVILGFQTSMAYHVEVYRTYAALEPNFEPVYMGETEFFLDPSESHPFGSASTASACYDPEGVNQDHLPQTFTLQLSTYPNPFNPTTTIRYTIPENRSVTVTIYDQLGREVNTLVDSPRSRGDHEIQWNGTDASGRQLGSGLYLCQVQAGGFSKTVKLVLMK